jgi:hypothetical protein
MHQNNSRNLDFSLILGDASRIAVPIELTETDDKFALGFFNGSLPPSFQWGGNFDLLSLLSRSEKQYASCAPPNVARAKPQRAEKWLAHSFNGK